MMCALCFMQDCKATLIQYICGNTSKLNSKQGYRFFQLALDHATVQKLGLSFDLPLVDVYSKKHED